MVKDSVGTPIFVGDKVVYNLSGELAYGRVEKITEKLSRNAFHDSMNYIVHITYLDGAVKYGKDTHVSKVGNTNCIIVI